MTTALAPSYKLPLDSSLISIDEATMPKKTKARPYLPAKLRIWFSTAKERPAEGMRNL